MKNKPCFECGGMYEYGGNYQLPFAEDGGPSKTTNSSNLNPIVQYYADQMYKRFGKVIITDKATNTTYYGTKRPDGTWDLAQFEVLTGKSHGINDQENNTKRHTLADQAAGKVKKNTALGTYTMIPYDYDKDMKELEGLTTNTGTKGYKLLETDAGDSITAYHVTYEGPDDKTRAALYNNGNNEDNYRSFGCVNCEKPSIQALEKFIGKGNGYATIIDTRLSLKENDQWIRKNTPQNSWMPPESDIAGSYTRSQNTPATARARNTGNEQVKLLQEKLNKELGTNLVVDGIVGPKTRAAQKRYDSMVRRQDLYNNMDEYENTDQIVEMPVNEATALPRENMARMERREGSPLPAERNNQVVQQSAPQRFSNPVEVAPVVYSAPGEMQDQAAYHTSKDSFYLPEIKDGGGSYAAGGAYYDDSRDAYVFPDGTVGPNGPANPEKMKEGGIPTRYKNMGFTHVGQKKEGDGQHKWKVLAKKGDQYKVVQGGDRGMQDFKQHHSEERREHFWDRMGGRDSAKAKDPFSPLYWHKRFGTWEEGGELPEMQNAGTTPTFGGDRPQFLRQAGPTLENLRKYIGTDKFEMYKGSLNPEPGNLSQDQQSNSPIGSLIEFMDPTGIMSHDDANQAYHAWKASGNSMPTVDQALSIFSAVPALGKFGKLKYMDPLSQEFKIAYKTFPWQQALNLWETQSESQPDYKAYGGRTMARGGEMGMYNEGGPFDSMIQEGDQTLDVTYKNQLRNLENNGWNRTMMGMNALSDPRSPIHYLPNKGFGSGLKAIAGLASGLSGAVLGYEKMFAKDKTDNYLFNTETKEAGKRDDVLKARWDKVNPVPFPTATSPKPLTNMTPTGGSGMGATLETDGFMEPQGKDGFYNVNKFKNGGDLPAYQPGGTRSPFYNGYGNDDPAEKQPAGNQMPLIFPNLPQNNPGGTWLDQWYSQKLGANNTWYNDVMEKKRQEEENKKPEWEQTTQTKDRGDAAGFVAGQNALIGLGMANNVLGQKQLEKQYNRELMKLGNSDAMYNAVNPSNPFGNYTTNVGIGPNFALVRQTPTQDYADANLARYGGMKKYKQGGSYMVSDRELMEILANGGDVEFL